MTLDEAIEVFHGRSSPTVTHVYFRLPIEVARDGVISGTISGPYCRHARTLPTTVTFRRTESSAEEVFWEAVFPDLCFWTMETPHWYRVSVTQTTLDGTKHVVERMWGARQLAAVRGRLFWNEHPTVLRIIRARSQWLENLTAWRDVDAVMLVDAPDDALCRAASEQGVALCAWFPAPRDEDSAHHAWRAQIARVARWPSVAMIGVEVPTIADDDGLRRQAPNTLIACTNRSPDECESQAVHASFVAAEHFAARQSAWEAGARTLLVMRSGVPESLAESRYACDELLDTLGPVRNLGGVGLW